MHQRQLLIPSRWLSHPPEELIPGTGSSPYLPPVSIDLNSEATPSAIQAVCCVGKQTSVQTSHVITKGKDRAGISSQRINTEEEEEEEEKFSDPPPKGN